MGQQLPAQIHRKELWLYKANSMRFHGRAASETLPPRQPDILHCIRRMPTRPVTSRGIRALLHKPRRLKRRRKLRSVQQGRKCSLPGGSPSTT